MGVLKQETRDHIYRAKLMEHAELVFALEDVGG